MKKMLGMTVLTLAMASLSTTAMAKDHGRGNGHGQHGRADKHQRHDERRGDSRRYHVVDGRRYPIVIRDSRDYYVRDGRNYPVVIVRDDGRDRRYHPQSGKWDNGRRGPPAWAKGKDYRSYGYERVVYVPVSDYGRYDLYAPQDGYRWVRDDSGKYLLVNVASGIIRDILMRSL